MRGKLRNGETVVSIELLSLKVGLVLFTLPISGLPFLMLDLSRVAKVNFYGVEAKIQ